ncbi:MAG: maleylpyruvate isomerase family mycothiol-dependent enzyme [Acidimicrobiia bacterium]
MPDEVITLLGRQWELLTDLVGPLSEEQWRTATECPGWSVADNIGHIIGTESTLSGEPTPDASAEVTTAPHVKNPIGAMNEAWVESLRSLPKADVIDRFRSITRRRLATLEQMSESDLDRVGPSPIGNVAYREFMDVRLMDCWVHEQDIRRALSMPGHHSGRIAERAIDRFVGAMGFIAARRASASDGDVVAFDLTGDGGRRFTVVVEGRRARASGPLPDGQTATVGLQMAAETFCCLALGRWAGPDVRARSLVAMSGDQALGVRMVDAMAFMI